MSGMVVLCLEGIQTRPEHVEPILFGERDIYPTHIERKRDGLWGSADSPRAQRLSAVGVYKEENNNRRLKVYHCPWATVPVPVDALEGPVVEHLT